MLRINNKDTKIKCFYFKTRTLIKQVVLKPEAWGRGPIFKHKLGEVNYLFGIRRFVLLVDRDDDNK